MTCRQTVPNQEAERHNAHEASGTARLPVNVRAVLIPVLVGLMIGGLFVGVFLSAFHDPKPHGLPVAVVAPASVVSTVQSQAAAADNALDVLAYPDRTAALNAVLDRTVLGAFVVGPQGPELLIAGANGPSVTQTLQGAFGAAAQASGKPLNTSDVSPLSNGDSRALSIFYGAFGVVLAAFLFALTSMQIGSALAAGWRALSAAVFAVGIGVVVAVLIQPIFGALPAPFLATTALVALLALAIAATTAALLKVFGSAGTFIASVLLLVLGNATSTGILPAQFLPGWLEPLAPVLPVGVAVRALRGAAYFANDGLVSGLLILTAWTVGAALVFTVAARRQLRSQQALDGRHAAVVA